MLVAFAVVGLVAVVVVALVVVGGEAARLSDAPKPAVFELHEVVQVVADGLPASAQARLSHDDVRWILLTDADEIDDRAGDAFVPQVVDEVDAVARILDAADRSGRDLVDQDVAAVLDGRSDYLRAIGAVGPEADPLA